MRPFVVFLCVLVACSPTVSAPSPSPTATETSTPSPTPSPTPKPPARSRSVTTAGDTILASGDFRGNGGTQIVAIDDAKYDFDVRITAIRDNVATAASAAVWFQSGPQFLSLGRAKFAVLDVDGDKKDDLVALYNSGSNTARIFVFRSNGNGFDFAGTAWSGELDWARARYVIGGRFGASAADALLVAFQDDGARLRILAFGLDGGKFTTPQTAYDSGTGQFDLAKTRFAAGHFTRIAAPDQLVALVQTNSRAKLVLFEPGANGLARTDVYQSDFDYDVTKATLAAGDVMGNSRDQVLSLGVTDGGSARVLVFDGTSGFAPSKGAAGWATLGESAVCGGPGAIVMSDLDRDGRADAIVLSRAFADTAGPGPVFAEHLLKSTGSSFDLTPGGGRLNCPVWPLTGLALGFGDATKRPLYVKTDNNPTARPHYGISKADIVYEWLVEGLTTRLAAVYQSQAPDTIGSVRSVRMTDRHVLPSLDAALVYSGGGPEELMAINYDAAVAKRYVDVSPGYGWGYRVGFRPAPYNYFTSYGAIQDALAAAPGGLQPAMVAPYRFLPTATGDAIAGGMSGSVAASNISIPYRALFAVSYRYDEGSRTYTRFQDGVREVDAANNVAIAARNVVVIQTEVHFTTAFGLDPAGNPKLEEVLTGSGKGVLFRDGRRQDVTWSRADVVDSFTLTNASGERVLLSPGQTWIHVVPTDWTIPSQ